MEEKKLICVLCGQEWGVQSPFTNRCENENCSGFCTWGYEPNKPESFFVDDTGKWHLKPPPTNERFVYVALRLYSTEFYK